MKGSIVNILGRRKNETKCIFKDLIIFPKHLLHYSNAHDFRGVEKG